MLHRLFTLVAAVSLLIFVALTSLWVRSHWVCDSIRYDQQTALANNGHIQHWFIVWSNHGSVALQDDFGYVAEVRGGFSGGDWTNYVTFAWERETAAPPVQTADLAHAIRKYGGIPGTEREYHALGFVALYRDQHGDKSTVRPGLDYAFRHRGLFIEIPWLALVLPASLLPSLWIYRWWKRRRMTAGVALPCDNCGYSLVGNITGVCPECGKHVIGSRPSGQSISGCALPAFASISGLLCLSAAVMIVRSYWTTDLIHVSNGQTSQDNALREITVSSSRGAFIVEKNSTDPQPSPFNANGNAIPIGLHFERLVIAPPPGYPSLSYGKQASESGVNGNAQSKQWSAAGFGLGYLKLKPLAAGGTTVTEGVIVPMPAIVLITALPTVFWIRHRQKLKHRAKLIKSSQS